MFDHDREYAYGRRQRRGAFQDSRRRLLALAFRQGSAPGGDAGGAKALGFEGELGVIQPGAIADLVGYRLDTISFSPLNDAVRQLVYSERGLGVDFSMIAGEVVMLDGQLTRIREREMLADIAREHADLRDRLAREETLIAPMVASMEKIYRRSLALPIPSDTFTARILSAKP